jgi:hypothetical protein
MPEIQICSACRLTINEATQQFVVTNKQESTYPAEWRYAHKDCYDKEQAATKAAA